jgi:response regulator NasT
MQSNVILKMSTELRVLLVDENPEDTFTLVEALSDAGYRVIARVEPDKRLKEHVQDIDPEMIVIHVKKPSDEMLESLRLLGEECPRPVVVFAEDKGTAAIQHAIKAGVSAYVVDGLTQGRIQPVIDVAMARFREINDLKHELAETRNKLSERKLVDRAKGILMTKRGLSEEDAYGAMRKMAMERNVKLSDLAKNIIDVSELLV